MSTKKPRPTAPPSDSPADPTAVQGYRGQFLVAMPSVVEGEFKRTVTLMCEHSENGALGLVINRPSSVTVGDMMAHLGVDESTLPDILENPDAHVFWGGPVQPERGFVVHSRDDDSQWDASVPLGDQLQVTSSRDVLDAIAAGAGPEDYIITLGYAGWNAGQLEQEVIDNTWLNTPSDRGIVFETPVPNRWEAAVNLLGVDISALSSVAGHG